MIVDRIHWHNLAASSKVKSFTCTKKKIFVCTSGNSHMYKIKTQSLCKEKSFLIQMKRPMCTKKHFYLYKEKSFTNENSLVQVPCVEGKIFLVQVESSICTTVKSLLVQMESLVCTRKNLYFYRSKVSCTSPMCRRKNLSCTSEKSHTTVKSLYLYKWKVSFVQGKILLFKESRPFSRKDHSLLVVR
jgi:hypothetical protein